jgi:hypothetical protein
MIVLLRRDDARGTISQPFSTYNGSVPDVARHGKRRFARGGKIAYVWYQVSVLRAPGSMREMEVGARWRVAAMRFCASAPVPCLRLFETVIYRGFARDA